MRIEFNLPVLFFFFFSFSTKACERLRCVHASRKFFHPKPEDEVGKRSQDVCLWWQKLRIRFSAFAFLIETQDWRSVFDEQDSLCPLGNNLEICELTPKVHLHESSPLHLFLESWKFNGRLEGDFRFDIADDL